jgi:hypothetical protein
VDVVDTLRNATSAVEPDPRTLAIAVLGSGGPRTATLDDQHHLINQFTLRLTVPESVRIHFETAKNLYLYAWFVYRFYMVSEHYVCSTLELALREHLRPLFSPRQLKRHPSLGELLLMAAEKGVISNARIHAREQWAMKMARDRLGFEGILKMQREGIEEMIIDESAARPTTEEMDFDWIGHFAIHLPKLRNMHAHGSENLYFSVLWTFEVVCDLINQLFSHSE